MMNPQELLSYLPALPVYLIWLVGGILALVRWHRHPRVSLIMLIATALFILGMLVNVGGFSLANKVLAGGASMQDIIYALTALRIILSLLNAAAYTLLLIAVFGWRGGRRPTGGAEDEFAEDDPPAGRLQPPGA